MRIHHVFPDIKTGLEQVAKPRRRHLSRAVSTPWGLALVLSLVCIPATCVARNLTICISQNPVPPLTYPDKEGEAQTLVRLAVERLGDTVNFVPLPWVRCRLSVKAGTYFAALPLAATPTNLTDFSFPMRNGYVDKTRNTGSMVIGVVRRIGSPIGWDGTAFSNLNVPVMVLPGQMSARDKLIELGVAQDAGAVNAESLLRKLVLSRGDVAVLPMGIIDSALKSEEFRESLEVMRAPLATEITFLGFNREFEQAERAYVQSIWMEISRIASSRNRRPAVGP